ncbi:MAG: Gfo/Idh/MocA family oxidoreductase [Oscillospiraceae bacterium]|jgi:predicted dehydrogenase|nr:Gfo/Idh/MocA family oxidoreductase [Oscillospiraceae bacterium]
MERKFRYGMVGGGPGAFIGAVHRAALRLNDESELVCGCFSSSAERREEMALELGISKERNYATAEEMALAEAAREDKIDFAVIVTPNYLHYSGAKAFLEQGIDVVSDKPLTFTVEESRDLKRIAAEHGCLFGVTYTYTGHVMAREMRNLIRSGVLGDIRMVMGEYPQDFMLNQLEHSDETNIPWRSVPALSGRGGSVADIGTHVENFVNYVTGLEIDSLCCHLDNLWTGGELDNNVQTLVKFKGGATGIYWASQVAIGYGSALKIRVFGDKGALEFMQEESNYLRLTLRGKPPMILSRGSDYMTPEAKSYSRIPPGHPEGVVEAFANIYLDFCRALRDKAAGKTVVEETYGYPTIDMAIRGVEFYNKCIDSSQAGSTWVKLGSE